MAPSGHSPFIETGASLRGHEPVSGRGRQRGGLVPLHDGGEAVGVRAHLLRIAGAPARLRLLRRQHAAPRRRQSLHGLHG